MEVIESGGVSDEVRSIIKASLELINCQGTVSRLVEMVEVSASAAARGHKSSINFDGSEGVFVERLPGAEAVKYLCRLCHHLLMQSSQALHDYCLLYTLAFHPTFLHQLWHLVRSSSQTSLFGSPTPLLSIISRGLKM